MGNYERGGRSGGGFAGGRGGSRGGFGGGRDGARPEMFNTTCAECGDDCKVPFRPTGERPVYCSDCFRDIDTSSEGRDYERKEPRGRGRDRDDRRDFEERKMYKATCADCGNECEVPFRPNGERPVYCSDCFVTDDKNRSNPRKVDESKAVLESLNAKMDTIIKMLEAAGFKNTVAKPVKEIKKELEEVEEIFAELPKKKTEKKVVSDKPKAEKKPAKKKAE